MLKAGASFGLQQLRKMASTAIPQIKNVDIDPSGTFKYILIKVNSPDLDGKPVHKVIVRGYADCGYHGNVLFFPLEFIQSSEIVVFNSLSCSQIMVFLIGKFSAKLVYLYLTPSSVIEKQYSN